MPDYFEEGFFVREPAWHGMGVVLDDYPGREEAMILAGHNFKLVERPVEVVGMQKNVTADGWKAIVKSMPGDETHGRILHIAKDTYGTVENDVPWDIVDAIVGAGAKYETGITLKGGAVCSVLAWLDEPVQIPGDNSPILPYLNVAWAHDGTGAITGRATSIRTVCWNTQSAAEMEGKKLGTDFTFRHTKKVMDRIEDAKMALKGIRQSHEVYIELARELAKMPVTANQRELFVSELIPMPPEALISDRVKTNIENARNGVRMIFNSPTIPDAHKLTAYGLQLAGVEYLDHVRGYRNTETRFNRSILRAEPAKMKLVKMIREVAIA